MNICKLCDASFKDYQGKRRSRCGSCNTKIRRYRAKAAAIKFLGSCCGKCGWKGDQAALQFHHRKKGKKEFTIGSVANKNWDMIKKELSKCVLLCANCHAIEHSSKDGKKFIKEAENYKGGKLEF